MAAPRFLACHYVQTDHMTIGNEGWKRNEHHELIYAVRGTYRAAVGRRTIAVEPEHYCVYAGGLRHRGDNRPDYFTTIIALQWTGGEPPELGPHSDRGGRVRQLLDLIADIDSPRPRPLHHRYLATLLAEMAWQQEAGAVASDRIERIRRFLDDWPGFATSLDFLCDRFAIARSTLLREFRKRTGQSPMRYLQRSRARRARQLLADGGVSAEVAEAVGVKTVPALSRLLQQVYGHGIRACRRSGRH